MHCESPQSCSLPFVYFRSFPHFSPPIFLPRSNRPNSQGLLYPASPSKKIYFLQAASATLSCLFSREALFSWVFWSIQPLLPWCNNFIIIIPSKYSQSKKSGPFIIEQIQIHLQALPVGFHLLPQMVLQFVGNEVAERVVCRHCPRIHLLDVFWRTCVLRVWVRFERSVSVGLGRDRVIILRVWVVRDFVRMVREISVPAGLRLKILMLLLRGMSHFPRRGELGFSSIRLV